MTIGPYHVHSNGFVLCLLTKSCEALVFIWRAQRAKFKAKYHHNALKTMIILSDQLSSFHAVFGKNWPNDRLATPPPSTYIVQLQYNLNQNAQNVSIIDARFINKSGHYYFLSGVEFSHPYQDLSVKRLLLNICFLWCLVLCETIISVQLSNHIVKVHLYGRENESENSIWSLPLLNINT